MHLALAALPAEAVDADVEEEEAIVFTSEEQLDRAKIVELRRENGFCDKPDFKFGLVCGIHVAANVPMLAGWLKKMPYLGLVPAPFIDSVDKCQSFWLALDQITDPKCKAYYNSAIAPKWIAFGKAQLPERPARGKTFSLEAPFSLRSLPFTRIYFRCGLRQMS